MSGSRLLAFVAAAAALAGCALPSNLRDASVPSGESSVPEDSGVVDDVTVSLPDAVVSLPDAVEVDGAQPDACAPCTGTPMVPVVLGPMHGSVLAMRGVRLAVRAADASSVEFRLNASRDSVAATAPMTAPVVNGIAELSIAFTAGEVNAPRVWSATARCGAASSPPVMRAFRVGTREPGTYPANTFEHIELDMNTDGRTDLAIASGPGGRFGGVYGAIAATTPTVAVATGSPTLATGLSNHLFSIGDFRGDGTSDVLMTSAGKLWIFDGGRLGLDRSFVTDVDLTFNGVVVASNIGRAATPLGDINGDGFSDFAIASYDTVYIVHGTNRSITTRLIAASSIDVGSSYQGIWSLAAADFDADGDVDLAVGAAAAAAATGRVLLYANTSGSFAAMPQREIAVANTFLFGTSLVAGAFVNDGSIDLAVASIGRVNPPIAPSIQLFTRPFDATMMPRAIVPSTPVVADAQLGFRMTSAGDVDADGLSELLVFAQNATINATQKGLAVVFEAPLSTSAPVEIGRITPPSGLPVSVSYTTTMTGCGTFNTRGGHCVAFSNESATVNAMADAGEVYVRSFTVTGASVSAATVAVFSAPSGTASFGRSIAGR